MYHFIDYQKDVLAAYRAMQLKKTLSFHLASPTPSNLKKECLAAFQTRFQKSDWNVLTGFFGKAENQMGLHQLMRKQERDKFKPIQNFITGDTVNPSPVIVELLAWLIDFQPRPHDSRINREGTGEPREATDPAVEVGSEVHAETQEQPAPATVSVSPLFPENTPTPTAVAVVDTTIAPKTRKRYRSIVAIGIALLLLGIAVWWYQDRSSGKPNEYMSSGPQFCMFWAGDHYQGINCNQKLGDTLVIAMDSVRLVGFRKVMQIDTVTERSIGHLWYARPDGVLELYTADGNHPEKPYLRLRPLTFYMYNKYIRK
jgi:hypothetical protein